ncbi:DUF5629 family protein [Stutzerimonas tarimensis]|uniref:DUF5629 family protein n=1 Tax=Stutzerimonas tarimensis TaxID=1507735 RepID=A0ABV7T2P0_9GAMM
MSTNETYLLDELEAADGLEIDGLFAEFTLNDALLDRADDAAEAGEPFESEDEVLNITCLDGRERRQWSFSYNAVMEAELQQDGTWQLGTPTATLRCLTGITADGDD